MPCRQRGQLLAVAVEERGGRNDEPASSLLDLGVKDGVALTFAAGLQDNEPTLVARVLHVSDRALS